MRQFLRAATCRARCGVKVGAWPDRLLLRHQTAQHASHHAHRSLRALGLETPKLRQPAVVLSDPTTAREAFQLAAFLRSAAGRAAHR